MFYISITMVVVSAALIYYYLTRTSEVFTPTMHGIALGVWIYSTILYGVGS